MSVFEALAKLIDLFRESLAYPTWKRKERFIRRQQIIGNVRLAISQATLRKLNPEFRGQNWWLEIRDHIHPGIRDSIEMARQDLEFNKESEFYVPYERRLEVLTSEVSKLAKKWKVE